MDIGVKCPNIGERVRSELSFVLFVFLAPFRLQHSLAKALILGHSDP